MLDPHDRSESSRPASDPAPSPSDVGTLVTWTADTGDSVKSHVVQIDQSGFAWSLGLKEPETFDQLLGEVAEQPAEAAALIKAHRGGHRLPRERLARVTYAEQLNQLTVIDKAGRRQHIAYGNDGEQGRIFEAVGRHLGGTAREEDADAWSVMKDPLFALAVTGVIGGFLIWFTTTADANAEVPDRSAGMQTLVDWLGYPFGTTWMSILVGTLALTIFSFMVYLLVKRPKRQVLDF